jgi:hypothetical protein
VIIIPKEKPVVENLNSYYLDIEKLLEHYQGELGTGGVHFNAPSAEGVIFFDKDDLLNGFFRDTQGDIDGKAAIDRLIKGADDNNFVISIYEIDAEKVYFWANIPAAKTIYKNLSTEFTDLEGLIKKMRSERLTGHIDVSIDDGKEGGLIFFNRGKVIGGSYSWDKEGLNRSQKSLGALILKTKESGGVFHVSRIFSPEKNAESEPKEADQKASSNVLPMLEELLHIFERVVKADKVVKLEFNTALKRKFMEKADEFTFLDPFVSEFEYADQKITFTGNADDEELAEGLTECVKEMAEELGVRAQLNEELAPWSKKHKKELNRYNLDTSV